jgi:hypothetical protein
MVQRAAGRLRVHLDRLQPRLGGCFEPGVQEECGNCSALPATWALTTGGDFADDACDNCASLNNGTWALAHDSSCSWKSDPLPAVCPGGAPGGPVVWRLYHQAGVGWRLGLENDVVGIMIYDPIPDADFRCAGPNTFVNPSWLSGTCTSASSATVRRA